MTTEPQHFVWEGRYQPIHRGHVAYVGELLKRCDTLTVVVVANELSSASPRPSPVPKFSAVVDDHHVDEKNPWPLWFRRLLVAETLGSEYPGAPITVLAGHRIDLDWDLYDQLLPPGRIFAIPTRDEFEDAKAAAWTALDQRVERIDVGHLPVMSSTEVRRRLTSGEGLDQVVLPRTRELLLDLSGRLDRSGGD